MNWIYYCTVILFLQFQASTSDWLRKRYNLSDVENLGAVLNHEDITYVAGNNYLLEINRETKNETKISIPPNQVLLSICKAGQVNTDASICTNSIKVVEKFNETHLLACGTNVLTPRCYYVDVESHEITELNLRVNTYVPTEPRIRVATSFSDVDLNPQLYSAFCQDSRSCSFSRFLNTSTDLVVAESRNSFRNPAFLNVYFSEREQKNAYLFYRDVHNIFENDGFTRQGKDAEYGMVARVCHSDIGGSLQFSSKFMTFMRARLLCPVRDGSGSDRPNTLYYDHLKSTYKIGNVVYGLFTLPSFWPHEGTAVCAFDLETIDSFIEGRVFPENNTQYYDPNAPSLTGPYPRDDNVPFLPGRCPEPDQNTRQVNAVYLDFVRSERTLIGKPITPIGGEPILITEGTYEFLLASEINGYHILYLLKGNSFMKKVRVRPFMTQEKPLDLFQTQICKDGFNVTSVSMAQEDILLIAKNEVLQVKQSSCEEYTNCTDCEQDPHCDWAVQDNRFVCFSSQSSNTNEESCHATPGSPKNLNRTGEYPTFGVKWDENKDGVPATSYQIELREESDLENVTYKIVDTTHYQLPGKLQVRNVNYVIKVYAINNNSLSQPNESCVSIDLETPFLQLEEVGNSAVTLSWSPVYHSACYNISISQVDTGEQIQSYLIKMGSSSEQQYFSVSGLVPNTNYEAKLYAISEIQVKSGYNSTLFSTTPVTTSSPSTTPPPTTTTEPTSTIARAMSYDKNTTFVENQTNTKKDVTTAKHDVTTTKHDVTTTKPSPKAANDNEPIPVNQAGVWSPLTILLIVFMALTVIVVLILVQNHCTIGSTKQITIAGKEATILERKCFIFWKSKSNKGYTSGQSKA